MGKPTKPAAQRPSYQGGCVVSLAWPRVQAHRACGLCWVRRDINAKSITTTTPERHHCMPPYSEPACAHRAPLAHHVIEHTTFLEDNSKSEDRARRLWLSRFARGPRARAPFRRKPHVGRARGDRRKNARSGPLYMLVGRISHGGPDRPALGLCARKEHCRRNPPWSARAQARAAAYTRGAAFSCCCHPPRAAKRERHFRHDVVAHTVVVGLPHTKP